MNNIYLTKFATILRAALKKFIHVCNQFHHCSAIIDLQICHTKTKIYKLIFRLFNSRSITGTLVHGKIATSVTTAVTKSAGVTSYVILSKLSVFLFFQFDKHDFLLVNVFLTSWSGSPKNGISVNI